MLLNHDGLLDIKKSIKEETFYMVVDFEINGWTLKSESVYVEFFSNVTNAANLVRLVTVGDRNCWEVNSILKNTDKVMFFNNITFGMKSHRSYNINKFFTNMVSGDRDKKFYHPINVAHEPELGDYFRKWLDLQLL